MTQKEALSILKTGANVFLTGAAGSGKTHVLREYIKYLKSHNVSLGVTASTGVAATLMDGQTIHAWSGLGIKDALDHDDLLALEEKSYLTKRLTEAAVLIIDEISMLHHFRLDLVDLVLKTIRKNEEPFGGLQVVLCGDFFQLPPVSRRGDEAGRFAYEATAFQEGKFKICYLSEQFRQDDDDYLEILNAIRSNHLSPAVLERLDTAVKKPKTKLTVSRLYPHNANVDLENEKELTNLPEPEFCYEASYKGKDNLVAILQKSCLALPILRLRKGAKVMFVKNNFEEGFANGTLGEVIDLNYSQIKVRKNNGQIISVKPESWRIDDNGKVLAEINQYPLRLAWAVTIHKSQGMSLDAAMIDLRDAFEAGMGYVALSRVRRLEGLHLIGYKKEALMVNEEVLLIDSEFKEHSARLVGHWQTRNDDEIESEHTAFVAKVGKAKSEAKKDTHLVTKDLIESGKSLKTVASLRNLQPETILTHLEKLKQDGIKVDFRHLQNELSATKFKNIYQAFTKLGVQEGGGRPLSPVKNLLGASYTFEEIRLVRLFL